MNETFKKPSIIQEKSVQWIKIMVDMFNHRKIEQIEVLPEADATLVIWIKLLCLAGKVNEGGSIMFTDEIAYTVEMLATHFKRPVSVVRLALETLSRFGMITVIDNIINISNWDKYQNIVALGEMKEYNRIKKRESRARLKNKNMKALPTGDDVNDMSMTINDCQPQEREVDSDKDIRIKNTNSKEYLFDIFWAEYPKKVGKSVATASWVKINPDKELFDKIMLGLKNYKSSKQWAEQDGRFIHNPSTWLNQKRWEDELNCALPKRKEKILSD